MVKRGKNDRKRRQRTKRRGFSKFGNVIFAEVCINNRNLQSDYSLRIHKVDKTVFFYQNIVEAYIKIKGCKYHPIHYTDTVTVQFINSYSERQRIYWPTSVLSAV